MCPVFYSDEFLASSWRAGQEVLLPSRIKNSPLLCLQVVKSDTSLEDFLFFFPDKLEPSVSRLLLNNQQLHSSTQTLLVEQHNFFETSAVVDERNMCKIIIKLLSHIALAGLLLLGLGNKKAGGYKSRYESVKTRSSSLHLAAASPLSLCLSLALSPAVSPSED